MSKMPNENDYMQKNYSVSTSIACTLKVITSSKMESIENAANMGQRRNAYRSANGKP
jgi:hypothetical protein